MQCERTASQEDLNFAGFIDNSAPVYCLKHLFLL